MICQCENPIQEVNLEANTSLTHILHSCLDLTLHVTEMKTDNNQKNLRLGLLVANKVTMTHGNLHKLEVYSDASQIYLVNFSTKHLRIVSPGKDVILQQSKLSNSTLTVMAAKEFKVQDTSITGKTIYVNSTDFKAPFPVSTSVINVTSIQKVSLINTRMAQVMWETKQVRNITIDEDSKLDILWQVNVARHDPMESVINTITYLIPLPRYMKENSLINNPNALHMCKDTYVSTKSNETDKIQSGVLQKSVDTFLDKLNFNAINKRLAFELSRNFTLTKEDVLESFPECFKTEDSTMSALMIQAAFNQEKNLKHELQQISGSLNSYYSAMSTQTIGVFPSGYTFSPSEQTPLMSAALTNAKFTAKFLIDKGANIHAKSKSQQDKIFGETALHFAAQGNSIDVAKLLTSAYLEQNGKANYSQFINALDKYRASPLIVAGHCKNPSNKSSSVSVSLIALFRDMRYALQIAFRPITVGLVKELPHRCPWR